MPYIATLRATLRATYSSTKFSMMISLQEEATTLQVAHIITMVMKPVKTMSSLVNNIGLQSMKKIRTNREKLNIKIREEECLKKK